MPDATLDGSVVLAQLLDHVHRLERNSYGWRAAHLHLSKLRAQNRRDFQLRIAASEFQPLLHQRKGELFQLADGDIIYLWSDDNAGDIDQVILRLRYLFSDDPLVSDAEPWTGGMDQPATDDPAAPRFCSWYDLERDYTDFRGVVERLVRQQRSAAPGRGRPLDPATLARLEHALAATDVSPLIRRQAICAMLPGRPPQVVLSEVHIAIAEMARLLSPGTDVTSDPWLFQRLAETLDRRLLHALAGAGDEEPVSINLRLATLLSSAFLEFDREFRRHNKREVVVELQLIDVFAELGGFMFIRDFLRERGYRTCIDGLHHLHLPLISRKRLGADLVKLVWSPDLLDGGGTDELRAAITANGIERVILCRCDSGDAVGWGQSIGIRLFQGHHLDSRLRAQRAPAVNAARAMLRSRTG